MLTLRQIGLFTSLSEETLHQLEQYLIQRNYDAGEFILFEKENVSGAYFIVDGRVQILRSSSEGREQILVNLGPGEAFSLVPLFQHQSINPSSARALTKTQCYFLPRDKFLSLTKQNSDLAFTLLKDFASKLSSLTNLVEQLSLHSIRGRLARFLIEQADSGNPPVHWTQDEIATHLGTVRDVIGRTLRSFEEAGLIQRQQGRIVLLDRKGLETEMEQQKPSGRIGVKVYHVS